jgi:hypothetical protein
MDIDDDGQRRPVSGEVENLLVGVTMLLEVQIVAALVEFDE